MGSGSKPASAAIMSVWHEQGQEQGQLQWPRSDTSLEGTPGTIWGLRVGSRSSRPGAGTVPVPLRALRVPVRAALWSDGNFCEKAKSSGFFSPTKRCFPH